MASIEVKRARDITIGALMERCTLIIEKLATCAIKGIDDEETDNLKRSLGEYVCAIVALKRLK